MKLVKQASGKTTIKMSRQEWTDMGKKAGWIGSSENNQFGWIKTANLNEFWSIVEEVKNKWETANQLNYIGNCRDFNCYLSSVNQVVEALVANQESAEDGKRLRQAWINAKEELQTRMDPRFMEAYNQQYKALNAQLNSGELTEDEFRMRVETLRTKFNGIGQR
jgi:hypothetical protein